MRGVCSYPHWQADQGNLPPRWLNISHLDQGWKDRQRPPEPESKGAQEQRVGGPATAQSVNRPSTKPNSRCEPGHPGKTCPTFQTTNLSINPGPLPPSQKEMRGKHALIKIRHMKAGTRSLTVMSKGCPTQGSEEQLIRRGEGPN